MTQQGSANLTSRVEPSLPFMVLAGLLIAAGVYARFKGLAYAPLSPDEYYLARSVEGILKHGVPAFDCGGFYQRGLGLQYLIAALRWLGAGPEIAGRSVAALASVITLPAVYLIARRYLAANGALLVVGIVAVSMWQIELARFGRMYAPFQAAFCWYLYFFLKYTVDRNSRSVVPMLWLTLAAALIWEGGVFLALANFVPLLLILAEGRLPTRREYLTTAVCAALLVATFLLATVDLRYASDIAPYPDGYSRAIIERPTALLDVAKSVQFGLSSYVAVAGLAGAVVFNLLALPALWRWRGRPLLVAGLAGALLAMLFHLLLVAVAALATLLLLKQTSIREMFSRPARYIVLALLATGLFWIAAAFFGADWERLNAVTGSPLRSAVTVAYPLVSFPSVVQNILQPFAQAVPLLGLILFGGLGLLILWQAASDGPLRAPERVAVLLVLLLLLAVGMSETPRSETRYVAFLYPLLVVLVVAGLGRLGSAWLPRGFGMPAVAVVALGLFVAAGDISWRHIAAVDSPEQTFRLGMKPALQAHLEIRDDVREIAEWLEHRTAGGAAVVINGVHGFDNYYRNTAYFFVDERDPNFPDWSCHAGAVDRWTNLPLVHSFERLAATRTGERLYLVTFSVTPQQLALLSARRPAIVMTRGLVTVIELQPT